MTDKYRVIVTGSRNWDDEQAIFEAVLDVVSLAGGKENLVIVHGDCPDGADALAEAICRREGIETERHPAEWGRYGRAAGPIRNAKMVSKDAHVVLAFPLGNSRGTRGCMRLAEDAGIPVVNHGDRVDAT